MIAKTLRHGALILALALPGVAQAHDPLPLPRTYDPSIEWLGRPTPMRAGQWRIRMIHHGTTRQAFLNTNQTYLYQQAYNRHLARLSFHMSIHRAEPRARHAAFHDVVSRYPSVSLERLDTHKVLGARILNPQ